MSEAATAPLRSRKIRRPSRRLLALFERYLRWYMARHFHAVRVANTGRFPQLEDAPLIVYLNHPSWWDPLTCMMIARRFMPQANHHAPMDEAALRRYPFFGRLGLFPVAINSARGAMQFVRSSMEIVSTPGAVLWLTPQGAFNDVRRRPPVFKDGLAALLSRLHKATVLPLAIEYTYWDERLPEVLVNCGRHISIHDGYKFDFDEWNATLIKALIVTQDELAALAVTRDASHFVTVLSGAAGIGGVYDGWQRARFALRGELYHPEHGSIHRP